MCIRDRYCMVLSEPRGRQASPGKVGRAVECTGLENRQGRKILVSSNLTPSAKTESTPPPVKQANVPTSTPQSWNFSSVQWIHKARRSFRQEAIRLTEVSPISCRERCRKQKAASVKSAPPTKNPALAGSFTALQECRCDPKKHRAPAGNAASRKMPSRARRRLSLIHISEPTRL